MRFKVLLLLLLMVVCGTSHAQFRKGKKKKSKRPEPATQPTTLSPLPQKEYAPKASKKASKGPTYESEEQYYERMARLAKAKRKGEMEQDNPRYTNPLYFGHKRPPKKHKPGKMRYCKECGIRH